MFPICVLILCGIIVAVNWFSRLENHSPCDSSFHFVEGRCCISSRTHNGACLSSTVCPPPLRRGKDACDVPHQRIWIPETDMVLGPSDWEAEGMVKAREVHTKSFFIDAFELTEGDLTGQSAEDRYRAAHGLSLSDAETACRKRGGRLPSEDEWVAAASGASQRRYPWGDTGAVCRRAAYGLLKGPCSVLGQGPDTVGAHSDGDTPTGIHDMGGNVAEWVRPTADGKTVVRGGSWKSSLATELRTWARREANDRDADPSIGARCAYDQDGDD